MNQPFRYIEIIFRELVIVIVLTILGIIIEMKVGSSVDNYQELNYFI